MNRRLLRLFLIVMCMTGLAHSALALRIYVLSCGDEPSDQAVVNVLTNAGHRAVLGPVLSGWDGTQVKLSRFHAVVLLYSYNYSDPDMPLAGQVALRSYVKAGGGLITGEWTLYESAGSDGTLQALKTVFPAVYAGNYVTTNKTTFTRAIPDPILDYNLGPSFTFRVEDVDGTESKIKPKTGAKIYYKSSAARAGLVGWTKGQGRVLNFSTTLTATELSNNRFRKLFLNAVRWVAAGGGVTQPAEAD